MNASELREQVGVELELLNRTLEEILSARSQMEHEPPSVLIVSGFGALLMNFYSGIENILRRIAVFEKLTMPAGSK